MSALKLDNLEQLAKKIIAAQTGTSRFICAIVGAPGSGKSTLAQTLQTLLIQKHQLSCQIVAMDGFHLDNVTLAKQGLLAVKGAPQTFDVAAFDALLQALHAHKTNVLAPTFDRSIDAVVPAAIDIKTQTKIILVEGNYLLLKERGWDRLHQYFNLSIFINVFKEELLKRLIERWITQNLDVDDAIAKADANDLPNAELVINNSMTADIELQTQG